MKKNSLNLIKEKYKKGDNIIKYLKDNKISENTNEIIAISYDFQSGNYIKNVEKNPEFNKKYTESIAKVINKLGVKYESILEAGVGEATTLANLISKLKIKPQRIYGFDIAWSRIRYALEYLKKKNIVPTSLFMCDLFNIPLADNSIDMVYTSHSIEPNGGREREALTELMRVTKKYLILLEPAYEFANAKARKRMEKHGYIKNLYKIAVSMKLNIKEHRLFDIFANPLNPTGIMVIEKRRFAQRNIKDPFTCPVTKFPLELVKDSYFTKKGLLVYPIIDEVPCLLKENALVATHFEDF